MFNKLAAIIRKDVKLRFEGRSELLFFLILPVVFTLIVGGGIPGQSSGDDRIYVPVVNEDGGERAATFLAALSESETIRPEENDAATAEEMLVNSDVGAVLVIPAGFSAGLTAEGLLTESNAEVILRASPGSNVGVAVQQEVSRAAGVVARPLLVARNSVAAVDDVRPFADDAARAAFFERSLTAAEAESTERPDRVAYSVIGGGEAYDQRAQSSAGQLVTWVFIPLLGASALFAMERALGTLRRLLTTPTRKSTFLLGSISGQFFVALAQMIILVLFGIYVMKVPWGNDPAALMVVLVTFGLAGVALGTALGTFVKTESQAGNLSVVLGMMMALLGGCWWPMELFPPTMQQVAKVLPTTWAMSALTDITMRGQGMAGILPEAAVLLGFAVVFFIIGVWRFRYE